LSEIEAKHLDNCSVQELAQLQYWLYKHQGSIFVKSIGRLALWGEEERKYNQALELDGRGRPPLS